MGTPLDDAHGFVCEVVAQSTAIQRVITLAAAVSHCVEEFSYLPRVAFLSDDMRTGKTTALKVAKMLASNPFTVTRATTDPTVLSAFTGTTIRPTVFVEETGEIFGRDGRAQKKPNLRLIVLDGFERSAVAQMTRSGVPESVSTFCLIFAAGRGAGFPDDGRDRAIICPMRRSDASMRAAGDQDVVADGAIHQERVRAWVQDNRAAVGAMAREIGTEVHPDLTSRLRDIWAPMFAMAHANGGSWPAHCLSAFRELALGNSDAARLSVDNRIRLAAGEFIRSGITLPVRADGRAILPSGRMLDHARTLEAFRAYRDRTLQTMICSALGDTTPWTVDTVKVRGWDVADIEILAADVEADLNAPREIRTVGPSADF